MTRSNTPSIAENTISAELANGLKIYVYPRPGSGTVFTQAVVRTGSIHEGEFLGCGLSHFLEHMVFSGTETHPGHLDIANRVNALGGNLNASTGYNSTQYYMEVPPFAANEALDMLYGMIARPLFPEERFRHEKNVILRESAMRNDNPYTLLYETMLKTAFSRYPARIPIIGYDEKIREVDRARMKAYYDLRYSPARTAFVVVGDVEPGAVIEHLTEIASSWRLGRLDEPVLPAEPIQTAARFEQTYYNNPLGWIAFAYKEPNRGQKDKIVQEVFSKILAGSESARLVRELVTKQQIADEVVASRFDAQESALSTILAVAAPEHAEKTIEGIRSILNTLKREPVAQNELDRIAIGIERGFWDVLRSNRGLGRLISSRFVENKPLEELEHYPELVRSISREEIMETAEKYHDSTGETLVLQLPESERKKKSTVSRSSSTLRRPEVKTLPGGQRLITIEDQTLPLVHFSFCLPGGNIYETKENAGVTELLTAMLTCGTEKYSEEKFDSLLDDNALELSVENRTYHINITASCMKDQLPLLTGLLKSMLSEPLLAQDVFERENAMLQRDLENDLSEPRVVAKMLTRAAILKDHPLGMTEEDDLASLKAMKRQAVQDFYHRILSPTQTVAAVTGAITEQEAEDAIREIFSAIPWSAEKLVAPVADHTGKSGVETVSRTMKKAQAVVMYGFPLVTYDQYSMNDALVLLASNGMASRLFKTVREERGLAYYVALSPVITDHASYLTYLSGTKPGAEKDVLALFEEERKLRVEQGFDQQEFEDAVAKIRFDIADRMQDAGKLADSCAANEYRGKGGDRIWQQLEEVETLTREGMNQAAKCLFGQPFRVMTAVSPENFCDFPQIQY